MNYKPNTCKWQIGDIVIHDSDAKHFSALMVITNRWNDDQNHYESLYLRIAVDEKPWVNREEVLHDPARFDITIPSTREILDRQIKALRGGVISNSQVWLIQHFWKRLTIPEGGAKLD